MNTPAKNVVTNLKSWSGFPIQQRLLVRIVAHHKPKNRSAVSFPALDPQQQKVRAAQFPPVDSPEQADVDPRVTGKSRKYNFFVPSAVFGKIPIKLY